MWSSHSNYNQRFSSYYVSAMIAFISKLEMCNTNLTGVSVLHHKLDYQSENEFRSNIITHPWMAAFLILPEHIFIGTASIITKSWTITTAYSVEKAANYPLTKKGFRGGSTFWNKGGYYHFAIKIIPHEKFDPYTLDYNIALIAVSYPFSNPNEVPIPLAGSRFGLVEDKFAEVVGWAILNDTSYLSDFLLHSKVALISTTVCRRTLNKY
ncbi:hypothetical protein ILUMI_15951 [Ignelater luminosus]|uniref:Peptidase S1 domain-containing protein n=1 Tax=Ignelater luminosus TaxID=2038154 RepID=A0A8K0CRY1_IGNLU|nr:hypothetical protein ILUMI_15951 [Ignelater luminosus]